MASSPNMPSRRTTIEHQWAGEQVPWRRGLTVAVAAALLSAGSSAAAQSSLLSVGNPVATFGVEAGDATAELSDIRSVVVNGARHVFLLDGRTARVTVLSPGGQYLSSFGRPGRGPGEFVTPVALAFDSSLQRLYVLDPSEARVTALTLRDNALQYHRTIPVPPTATGLCALDGNLYLYGVSPGEQAPIHVVDTTGAVRRAFGTAFGAEGGPMMQMALGAALIVCDPASGLVVLASRGDSQIRAYRPSGTPAWQVSTLPGFLPPQIEVLPQGGWRNAAGPRDPWSMNDHLTVIGNGLVAIQSVRTNRTRAELGRTTHLIELSSGRLIATQEGLPAIIAVIGGTAITPVEEPFPQLQFRRVTQHPRSP